MSFHTAWQWLVARALPTAWLLLLTSLCLVYSTPHLLEIPVFSGLAAAGLLYVGFFAREEMFALWRSHRALLCAAVLVVVGMLAAAGMLHLLRPDPARMPLPVHLGLLLCIWPLAVLLTDPSRRRMVGIVFAFVCAFHLISLPLEAVTGNTPYQPGEPLYPRQLGPLNYQARGMAWQVYYFPGLFLGMLYFAAALLHDRNDRLQTRWWVAASLLWAAAVACLQSRSAFAGAAAAGLLALLHLARLPARRLAWIAASLAAAGVLAFWLLFSENKSSGGLRLAYMWLYLQRSFDAQWLFTGRGYTIAPDTSVQVPGLQYLMHSHNDVIQLAFTWGVLVLAFYVMFWAALLWLLVRVWRAGDVWPALAIVAVGPSLLTDLGIHHLEKTAFIAWLAAIAMAVHRRSRA